MESARRHPRQGTEPGAALSIGALLSESKVLRVQKGVGSPAYSRCGRGLILCNSNRIENDSSSQTTVNVIKLSHQLYTPEYLYNARKPSVHLTCLLEL